MDFIRGSFLRWVFLFCVGFCVFSFSGNVNFFEKDSSFVASAVADGYSGLTNEEKNYLKSQGYSDQQISKASAEAVEFVSSGGTKKYSDASKGLMASLYKKYRASSSVSQALTEKRKENMGSETAAWWKGLAQGAWEGLTGKQVLSSYSSIQYAFTLIDNGCWFCPVFKALFTTVNNLAAKTNQNLQSLMAGGATSVLGILLLGIIIFTVAKAFLSFKEMSGWDLFTSIFPYVLRTSIAAILIWNWQAIYSYAIDPLLIGSIGLGQEMQTEAANSFTAEGGLEGMNFTGTCDGLNYTAPRGNVKTPHFDFRTKNASKVEFVEVPASGVALSDAVGGSIQCFLKTVSQNLIVWMAVGAALVADSWKAKVYFIFPNIQMMFIGWIIFIGGFLIFLSFPLKFLDAMFKLMFVTALMPLWIAFWVIPQTRGYTKKAWDMLINIMATFVIMSVVLVMVLQIISSIFTKSVSGIELNKLADLLASDKAEKAMEEIDFSSLGIFLSAAMMYLAFSLIGKAETFVSQFADAKSLGVGADVSKKATAATQLGARTGVAVTAATGRLASKHIVKPAVGKVKAWGANVARQYREGYAEGRGAAPGGATPPPPGGTPAPGGTGGPTPTSGGSGGGAPMPRDGDILSEDTPMPRDGDFNNPNSPKPNNQPDSNPTSVNTFADPDAEGAEASASPDVSKNPKPLRAMSEDVGGNHITRFYDEKNNLKEQDVVHANGERVHSKMENGKISEKTNYDATGKLVSTETYKENADGSFESTTTQASGASQYVKNSTDTNGHDIMEVKETDASGKVTSHTRSNLTTGEEVDLMNVSKQNSGSTSGGATSGSSPNIFEPSQKNNTPKEIPTSVKPTTTPTTSSSGASRGATNQTSVSGTRTSNVRTGAQSRAAASPQKAPVNPTNTRTEKQATETKQETQSTLRVNQDNQFFADPDSEGL